MWFCKNSKLFGWLLHALVASLLIESVARLSVIMIGVHVHQPFVVSQRVGPNGVTNAGRQITWVANESGARGELYHGQPSRIAVFGTSTSSGVFLDQEESWPEQMRRTIGVERCHVDNFAVDGGTVPEAIAIMTELHQRGKTYDTVVIQSHVSVATNPDYLYSDAWQSSHVFRSLDIFPSMLQRQLKKESHLKVILKWVRNRFFLMPATNTTLDMANRSKRNSGQVHLVYEKKSVPRDDIRMRTRQLLTAAKKITSRVIFVTQPVAYSHNAHPEVARKWFTLEPIGDRDDVYYDNRSLAEAIRETQAAMIEVAESMNVEVLNLDAAMIPLLAKTPDLFDDKWHPSPLGAEFIGKNVANRILSIEARRLDEPPTGGSGRKLK